MMHNGPDKYDVDICTNIGVWSAVHGQKYYSSQALRFKSACLQVKEGLSSRQRGPTFKSERTCLVFKADTAYLQGSEGLPSMQGRPSFKTDMAYLQGSEGLPSMQRRPAFNAERAYLQGREGLVFGMASTSSQNLHLSCCVLQLSLQSCQGKLVLLLCPVLPLLADLNLSSQSLDLWVTYCVCALCTNKVLRTLPLVPFSL